MWAPNGGMMRTHLVNGWRCKDAIVGSYGSDHQHSQTRLLSHPLKEHP